ncbi:protein kinase [Nocardia sp. NPDC050175]|uniref:protein kinase domain-containing protein n=1 Tax=Nocardia sp. NPDC050175 TaxID=3364317 RepID=UPI0037A4192E
MAETTRLDGAAPDDRPARTRLDPRESAPPPAPATRLDHPEAPPSAGAPATRLDNAEQPTQVADRAESPEFYPVNLPPGLASRFRITGPLGSGGEAWVWRCADAAGNEHAIKLFHHPPRYRGDAGSRDFLEQLPREHTVQVEDRGVDHGVHYEVMEYCRFGALEDFLTARGGVGTNKHAVEILEQIATSLRGLQQSGGSANLVHADMNPRNVLVRNDGPLDLVIADFGLTVDLGGRSKLTNTGQGTIGYSAPGALQHMKPADDWWSVGMIMYRVLVGRGYFQDDEGRSLNERTIEAEINTRDISLDAIDAIAFRPADRERWKLLLAGLLTRDPDLRWGMAEVQAWLAGESPAVYRSVVGGPAAPQPAQGARRASVSFALPGVGDFYEPAALGSAMARHPEAAARALSGRGRQALVNWLTDEVRTGAPYTDLKTYGGHWGPDELATYFTAQLDPAAPLTYCGWSVTTPEDLCVISTNPRAFDAVVELYDKQLLGCLAGPGARSAYRMVEANWRDIVEQALDLARARLIDLGETARNQVIGHGLLVSAADQPVIDAYLDNVRQRLDSPDLAPASAIPWFAELRREARL